MPSPLRCQNNDYTIPTFRKYRLSLESGILLLPSPKEKLKFRALSSLQHACEVLGIKHSEQKYLNMR
jgi:hypothetical protein